MLAGEPADAEVMVVIVTPRNPAMPAAVRRRTALSRGAGR
jgi:hypothetical protein